MIAQALVLIAALAAGTAFAWLYFKSLWLSVQHLSRHRRPALWMTGTLTARLAAAVGAFLIVERWGGWTALVACLAGFAAARVVLVRRLPRTAETEARE